jgi:uncharacterized protein
VRRLLAAGAIVDVTRRDDAFTPLLAAAQEGYAYAEVAALLLADGADPDRVDSDERTPLIAAAFRGHADVVQRLLDAGADPDLARRSDRVSALHLAVQEGFRKVVDALIAAGAT